MPNCHDRTIGVPGTVFFAEAHSRRNDLFAPGDFTGAWIILDFTDCLNDSDVAEQEISQCGNPALASSAVMILVRTLKSS